ncbi:MAG: aminotransferase class I/II-fold pyridoxal phosphate-dependent enzyme [Clostridiales bacterium]|nr:aminotransferase class I/II-fold pyridoxal phosphate-dependent enzyme [Clostridiales bacterium]
MTEVRHGGDIYRNPVRLDYSVNCNPLGMPDPVKEALRSSVESWAVYPDRYCDELREKLAEKLEVKKEWILCGNGAAELIYDLVAAVRPRKARVPVPSFTEYEAALSRTGCAVFYEKTRKEERFRLDIGNYRKKISDDTDLVILCNPNNPNGFAVNEWDVRELADRCRKKGAVLLVDECFAELTEKPQQYSVISACGKYPNLVVLRAFTKTFAMAGLRLGYLVTSDRNLLEKIRRYRQPWNVSVPAQVAGIAAVSDVSEDYLKKSRELIAAERIYLTEKLAAMGFHVFPSAANYLLFESPVPELYEKCLKGGLLIRDCSDYQGLVGGFYRISVRTRRENEEMLEIIRKTLETYP